MRTKGSGCSERKEEEERMVENEKDVEEIADEERRKEKN